MARKKKGLVDEARDLAHDVSDAARPHLETMRESASDFVHDTALPSLQDARDHARERAEPIVAAGAAELADRAEAARAAASDTADSVAEAAGRPRKKKRSKLKIAVVLGALAGGAAFVAKKLKGDSADPWSNATAPTPPTPSPGPTAVSSPPAADAERENEDGSDQDEESEDKPSGGA